MLAWSPTGRRGAERMDPAVVQTKEEVVMSIKGKVVGAAAALAVVGGVGAVGTTMSATAATPQCGPSCIQVFSPRFGTVAQPNFIENVRHGVAKVGQPTILDRASSSNPAGDLMVPSPGLHVSDFFAAGTLAPDVNSHFGSLPALQLEFTPLGKASGLCVGVAKTAFANEGLTLQPCSVPGTTVWIIDPFVAPASLNGYFAIINGSTTDFSHPFTMTYTHKPPARIRLDHLQFSQDGTAPLTQLWSKVLGPAS
jgi:hypothetical protein